MNSDIAKATLPVAAVRRFFDLYPVGLLTGYVLLHASNSLVLKALSNHGLTTGEILVHRGIFCLFLLLSLCALWGQSLKPKNRPLALKRLALGGAALAFTTASYSELSASAASLVNRLDVAFCVLMGPLFGATLPSGKRRWALFACFVPLGGLVIWSAFEGTLLGLSFGLVGVTLLSLSYFLLKSATQNETILAVVLVPSVAIVLFGSTQMYLQQSPFRLHDATAYLLCAAAGAIMFWTYDFTARLYRRMTVSQAEYPTLFSALLVLPAEVLLFSQQSSLPYIALVCLQIATLWILTQANEKKEVSSS